MRNRCLILFTWASLLAGNVTGHAQQLSNIPRQDFWVTDGAVDAIAVTNNRVFIGGSFRYVGPFTGGGVPVDVNTMQPVAKYPKVNGSVHAVEPDGQGGWFIGGLFTAVGGWPRTNLAHITVTGEVDTNWTAQATGGDELGRVDNLAFDGKVLYAAGAFTNLGGLARKYVGAMDAETGAVNSWAPQVDTNVLSIAISPTAAYLGGKFLSLNGVERRYIGAVDKTNGATLSWNPYNNPLLDFYFVSNTFPRALAVANGLVYVPGRFANFFDYHGLDAFRETDATIAWGVGKADSTYVYDLKVHSGVVYVVGAFYQIGGDGENGQVNRDRVAALDALTGEVLPWAPVIGGPGWVNSITFSGNTAYVGGAFESPNPQPNEGLRTNANYVAAFDLTTGGEILPRRPANNGWVHALAAQNGQVYFGGAFDSVGGVWRQHLAALDRNDGSLQPWNPEPDRPVAALAFTGDRLLVGGAFSKIFGQARSGLAALEAGDLTLTDWAPAVTTSNGFIGSVQVLVPSTENVLVAGGFNYVGGQPRNNVAMINRDTGSVTAWRADTDDVVETATIAAGKVYVGGQFSTLGGQPRRYLGSVDLDTATVTDWNPSPDNWVTSLSANSTAIYSAGYFMHVSGGGRTGYAAHSLSDGSLLAWNIEALQPSLWKASVLARGDDVVATGIFYSYDGAVKPTVLRLDGVTGTPADWNTLPYIFSPQAGLVAAGDALFLMGEQNFSSGITRRGLAVFETAGFSRFTQLTPGDTGVGLQLSADQGREFVIERTTDFNTWTGVSTNTAWEGIIQVRDSPGNGGNSTFYQARTTARY